MTLACGSDRDKKHLLILSFNVALESYTVLKAVLLPASSAHEAYSDSETLRDCDYRLGFQAPSQMEVC